MIKKDETPPAPPNFKSWLTLSFVYLTGIERGTSPRNNDECAFINDDM